MFDETRAHSPSRATYDRLLLAFTVIAVVVGVVVRFKGLGAWALGPDEYYSAQSVQNILRTGLPEYPCGGFYERGIVFQYLTAGLRLLGFSAELAPRAIAALSSLLALPAAYLLGRRLHGQQVGLLAVALISLSVWEIEMARFGRMYAPFQAIFLWHLVYFVRYAVDREVQALRGMFLLTVLGVLVWEGGVLQIAINLLPPFINHERGRLSWAQWRYLGLMGLAMWLIYLYWTSTVSLRVATEIPAWPPDIGPLVPQMPMARLTDALPDWQLLAQLPTLWVLGVVVLAFAASAVPWVLRFWPRWLAVFGLLAALAAACAHQFLIFVAVLTLLLLARILEWRELLNRGAWRFHAAIAGAAVFWVVFGSLTDAWRDAGPPSADSAFVDVAYALFGFPELLEMVARPWARAVPWLALSLVLLLGVSAARVVFKGSVSPTERALLITAVVLLLLVGVAEAPRLETRYTFFLYPLFLIVGITVLFRWFEQLRPMSAGASLLGTAVVLVWFAFTEDFQPGHLLRIDSADISFRRGMSSARRSHYYGRGNIRATADWLRSHSKSDDLIVSGPGVAALDFYFPELDFVYVDLSDQRLRAWSCQRGTVERWSNLPLVYKMATFESRIAEHERSYIVVAKSRAENLLARLRRFGPRIVWTNAYGLDVIVLIDTGVRQ